MLVTNVHCLVFTLVAFSATVFAAYEGLYFVQHPGKALVVERADPILSPGGISSHVHTVMGGNGFSTQMTYADTQASTCSTMNIKADKSNYWFPTLFFHAKNGTFIPVPEKAGHSIYWDNRSMQNETIEAFPDDFRMIAGNAMSRAPAATTQIQHATQWSCHGPPVDVHPDDGGFPKGITACGYGLAASIHYPHCWNGQPFDPNNPSAHVSYPQGDHPDSGYCPSSHSHVMPHLFVELWFDVSKFNGLYGPNDNPWVMSQGDPTGYGFHGDFINGWDHGVLLNAMNNCDIGESGRPLSDCFELWPDAQRNACFKSPDFSEDVSDPMPSLPGCNPIQNGPQPAVKQTCPTQKLVRGRRRSRIMRKV